SSMLGVYSAFALQNWGEERKKKALTKKILEALLYDLSSNIKALDKLQDSNIFPIFSVVNWKNWENRIELDDIHIQGKMCNLFDYFKDINDVIKDKPQVKKLWIDYMKKDVSNLKEELNNLIKYIREYYKREYNEDILTDKNSIMENKSQ
ncbi:TPA: hypothetical protein HA344_05455, partial [Candidatus Bathyarchaeota archaeon]|nr:hypothetical protein [Candidatus Bathyarchaeota archaeon]